MRRALLCTIIVFVVIATVGFWLWVTPIASTVALRILNELPSSGGPPVPVATADFTHSGPGSLVTATTMPGVTRTIEGRGFEAARVLYRSTSGDTGMQTVVSGSVFTPKHQAPRAGWPVVAFGHGTLGIESSCAPSLSPSLLGLVPVVQVLVKLGYAVAVPDYQGLGTKGVHPYSDSRTAGLNMIDAVRALKYTFPNVSDRWAALGDSQGGSAAWSADEQAASYAPELQLLGALASSPAPDLTGLVDKAEQSTLTSEQQLVAQGVIESLARLDPDFDRDDYRHGAAAEYWNVLSDCSSGAAYRRATASKKLRPADFAPRTAQAADRLRELLQQWALPQKPLSAPLYVWYGGKDPFIDAAWTAEAIRRACASGGIVTIEFDPDGGHNPPTGMQLIKWMEDRFAGKPATNDC